MGIPGGIPTGREGVAAGQERETPPSPLEFQPGIPVRTSARPVAWAGLIFGVLGSIAGNIENSWLPATHMPAGWHPPLVRQLGDVVWPVALLLAVEILSRTPWPRGLAGWAQWGWAVAKTAGLGGVALCSATISVGHIRAVLDAWGYGVLGSLAGPGVLDGLMVLSGFALIAAGRAAHAEPVREPLAEQARESVEPLTTEAAGEPVSFPREPAHEPLSEPPELVPVSRSAEPLSLPPEPVREPARRHAPVTGQSGERPLSVAERTVLARLDLPRDHRDRLTRKAAADQLGVSLATVGRMVPAYRATRERPSLRVVEE